MNSEELGDLREIMERHGFSAAGSPPGQLAFEKAGVRVQAWDSGEAFDVQHGTTKHVSPSLVELEAYLNRLKL